MGTWGAGLQANDIALGVIDDAEKMDHIERVQFLFELAEQDNTQGMLGLAEWMLDNDGVIPKVVQYLLLGTVMTELEPDQLDCWVGAEERAAVLTEFVKRLRGQKYDKGLVAASNEGLMSKLRRGV